MTPTRSTRTRIDRWVGRAVVGVLAIKLTGLAINLRAFPVLQPLVRGEWTDQHTAPGPTVCTSVHSPRLAPASRAPDRLEPAVRASLLIPARDEERNLRQNLAGVVAQPAHEVLVLDDGSTDTTAEVVAEFARTDDRARLIRGEPLPDGWVGKNWACHQLAAVADGDLLVFVDADVSLAAGALDAAIAEMARQDADVFSVFPRQRTGSLGERLTVPLIDDVLLCLLPHPLLRAPVPAAATANGQLLIFKRSAYERLGGHAAVRQSIVEDVRIAHRTRQLDLRLGLALGGDLVQVRMYEGYRAAVAGIAKSLPAAHGGSRLLLVITAAGHLIAYTVPWLRTGRVWRAAVVLGLLERLLVNAKTGRRSWWESLLTPVTPVAAIPVYVRAGRRSRTWKGRTYR